MTSSGRLDKIRVILFLRYLPLVMLSMSGLFAGLSSGAQDTDSTDQVFNANTIFRKNIKTVLFYREGWDLSSPLIRFNTGERLHLEFDDLDADGKEYTFTIEHCDAFWKPSGLEKYRYIEGYEEDYIYEYRFSNNTIVPYTHYDLLFPTASLKPSLPGNYLLSVYAGHPDSLYFTRRFMVVDQQVSLSGMVHQATASEDKKYKQEIDFEIWTNNYRIDNPYSDLKVVIIQNGRWDNQINHLKPKMVINNRLDYNYDYENIFDGGNEFRALDIKSLNYTTENIAKIEFTAEGYQVTLQPDEKRTFTVYKTEPDINGQSRIKTEDQQRSEIESEYVFVHFSLAYPAPVIDGTTYIVGALTDWNLNANSALAYDYRKKCYTKTLLLKQGYYNYQYLLLDHGAHMADVAAIEGNHWETENEYTICVYNREQGEDYDKLIGVEKLNSLNK